jgi:acetylornithine deacetylase
MVFLSPVSMLERLVSFDTESAKSNLPLIAFVEEFLTSHGVRYVKAFNAAGNKAAILTTVGPMVDGGIVLSGHTDVVPVAGQAWTSDPFALRKDGGKFYARGACDMKAFDAICLSLLPELARRPLKAPVHVLLSYDEETTCLGVMDIIAMFGVSLPRPRAVIVGEPSRMQVADAHKSVVTFFTTVTGFENHSSHPRRGVNAINGAVMLIAEINRMAEEYEAKGDPTGRFDPAWTTIHVGTVSGGTARNITARECRFHWEFRGVPGLDNREIPARLSAYGDSIVLPKLRAFGKPATIITENEVEVPGLAPDPGSAAESLALRLTASNRTITVPYGSEAGRFQLAGVPTVICGPGDIAQAHQPDEWIEESEIEACIAFVRRLGEDLSR